jgi:hypothetical protein
MAFIATIATATAAAKATVFKVFKLESFVDFQFKFKAFYIQIKLGI